MMKLRKRVFSSLPIVASLLLGVGVACSIGDAYVMETSADAQTIYPVAVGQKTYMLVDGYQSVSGYLWDSAMDLSTDLKLTGGLASDDFRSVVYVPVRYDVEWRDSSHFTLTQVVYGVYKYDNLSNLNLSSYGAFAVYAPSTNIAYYYGYGVYAPVASFDLHSENTNTLSVTLSYDNQSNLYGSMYVSFDSALQHYGYCHAKSSYFMPFYERHARAVVASYPNSAYDNGYGNGWTDGYTYGYDQGNEEGYAAGYAEAQAEITNEGRSIANLFGAIASVPITVLNGLGGFTIWNVSLIAICMTFLFLGLVLWIVRKFI